jgi:AAA15 family ATPase/GTPase
MINKLEIHGFQSHLSTDLVLSPGVNVIIGQSNSGKSAILRAFNWVTTNRPLGDGFIKHGEKEAKVCVFKSNAIVSRCRGSRENKYTISNGENNAVLTAFGQEVPPQVLDVLGFSDINVQRQFSPYFLVFDSPGSVAEYIRSITDSDEIDMVTNAISSELRTKNSEMESIKLQVSTTIDKLKELETVNLNDLKSGILRSTELVNDIDISNSKITSIIEILDSIQEIDSNSITLPDNTDDVIQASLNVLQLRDSSGEKCALLSCIIDSICKIDDSIINIGNYALDSGAINTSIDTYNKTVRQVSELEKVIIEIKLIETHILETTKIESTEQTVFDRLMSELTTCPLCGEVLSDSGKNRLCGNQ